MQTIALTEADIPACMALSTEAGWNQSEADWRRILASGEAHGLTENGALIASSAILPYGTAFGWICMILVTGSARRRGHAIRLMNDCIDRLEQRGFVAGLDATPAGRKVYVRLGFEEIFAITRFSVERVSLGGAATSDLTIAPLSSQDWPNLLALDTTSFGSDRESLLKALQTDHPDMSFVARRNGVLTGFALARSGRFATHIGPVVADAQDVACDLIGATLRATTMPVSIDVPDHQRDLIAWLERTGFHKQRDFTRMLRGRKTAFGEPQLTMAITGPEFG